MSGRNIVVFVAVVFIAMRGERENCFFIEMYEFFK